MDVEPSDVPKLSQKKHVKSCTLVHTQCIINVESCDRKERLKLSRRGLVLVCNRIPLAG